MKLRKIFLSLAVVGSHSIGYGSEKVLEGLISDLNLNQKRLPSSSQADFLVSYEGTFLPEDFEKPLSESVYVRKNVQQQSLAYRKIFNRIYHQVKITIPDASLSEILKSMSSSYDQGFLSIFKEGVLIGRNYIRSNAIQPDSEKYLKELEDLWNEAKDQNKNKVLTGSSFVTLNIKLATLISAYKKEGPVNTERYPFENRRPIFIIYGHPDATVKNRGIAKKTFVNEYVGEGFYPSWLALLDVHSTPKRYGTKHDAHYSIENGTLRMLLHDLNHIWKVDQETERKVFPTIKAGHEILQKVRLQKLENDSKVLEDGLFLLFHESAPAYYSLNEESNFKRLKIAGQHALKRPPKRPLSTQVDYIEAIKRYKEEDRDQETVLKNKDKYDNIFLPLIKMANGKERLLPVARAGNQYTIIEKIEDFKEGMTWVFNHQDLMVRISKARNDKISPILQNAFKDFWNRFIEILDENSASS